MELGHLARAINGRVVGLDGSRIDIRGVSTDTRTIRTGEAFFALRGPRFDGHRFIDEAFRRGAAAAVVEESAGQPTPQVIVADTIRALGDLAAAYRMALSCRVVAITGSVGKTTTKDMIAHILSDHGPTVRAPASYNNQIGVPLTVMQADPMTKFLVVEVGVSHVGDMERLASILRPDIAVVTTIAETHLEGLGSIEGVAKEKGEILRWLRPGGTAVLNGDNPWTRRMAAPDGAVWFSVREKSAFQVRQVHGRNGWVSFILDGVPFKVRGPSVYQALNAAAAAAACSAAGVTREECARRLLSFSPPPMRLERTARAGVRFLNDAYNANPTSLRAALAAFVRQTCRGRRIAVIGDMKELGAAGRRCHEEVVRFAANLPGLDGVVLVGPEMARAGFHADGRIDWAPAADAADAARFLRLWVRPGDAVLLKASRAMGLERVLESFPPEDE